MIFPCPKRLVLAGLIGLGALCCPAGYAMAGYYNATTQAATTTALPTPKPTVAEADVPPLSGFSSVTSLATCLEQLPETERAEVRQRYARPYQECQRRAGLIREKAALENPATPPPGTPKGATFLKVWTGDDKPAPKKTP